MPDWYEKATKAIVAKINSTIDECGDMPDPEDITAIIAKHDPNRWVLLSEKLPPEEQERVQAFGDGTVIGIFSYELRRQFRRGMTNYTHWRPVVLPEVKE